MKIRFRGVRVDTKEKVEGYLFEGLARMEHDDIGNYTTRKMHLIQSDTGTHIVEDDSIQVLIGPDMQGIVMPVPYEPWF